VGAILEDFKTGKVLYSKAPDKRRPIASLTKIMTALVVLASADLDDVVVVAPEAVGQIGSSIGLRAGERLTVRDLLYAMLLPSANDAAVALAHSVGGSVGAFVRLMNVTASRMGLHHSHFASSSGLDDSGYSTARDLAALTRRAFRNSTFARIVSTLRKRIPGPKGTVRRLVNRNNLLRVYPGAFGVKSGFTTRAGHCLVGAAGLNGLDLLSIVLGAKTDPFDETIRVLNYGFGTFERVPLLVTGELVGRMIVGGQSVDAVSARDVSIVLRKKQPRSVTKQFVPIPPLGDAVLIGDRVGEVKVFLNGRLVASVRALAHPPVNVRPSPPPPVPIRQPSAFFRAIQVLAAFVRAAVNAFL
jgi:D-alanyl-D-alanine carboxypeptidase (penicillin-binding protein 5/6)